MDIRLRAVDTADGKFVWASVRDRTQARADEQALLELHQTVEREKAEKTRLRELTQAMVGKQSSQDLAAAIVPALAQTLSRQTVIMYIQEAETFVARAWFGTSVRQERFALPSTILR